MEGSLYTVYCQVSNSCCIPFTAYFFPGGFDKSPHEDSHVGQHPQNLPRLEPRPITAEEREQVLQEVRRLRQGLNQRSQPQAEEKEKFEYGSRQADAAAKKLQSLGTLVYPPGNKQAIDWGILAGNGQHPQLCVPAFVLACIAHRLPGWLVGEPAVNPCQQVRY